MSLEEVVTAFRDIYKVELTAVHHKLLDLLVAHSEIGEAWGQLFETHNAPVNSVLLIRRLLVIKAFADQNPDLPAIRQDAREKLESLLESCRELEAFFRNREPIFAGELGETYEFAQETNMKVRACQTSMRWAQAYIARMMSLSEGVIDREFPSSQKRDLPHRAFAIQLCREFEKEFGSPSYRLVTAITAVWFTRKDAGLRNNIESAYRADRQRRVAA